MRRALVLQIRQCDPCRLHADINVNVRDTISRMTIGLTSACMSLRDGVLDATLGGMQLYDGQGSGNITVDAPARTDLQRHISSSTTIGAAALGRAAGFNLLAGRTNIALELSGAGGSGEQIKHSLEGNGSIDITDGSIEGINLTELILMLVLPGMPKLSRARRRL